MRNTLAQIYYIEWRVFGAIVWLNIIHFHWKRALITLGFILVMVLITVCTVTFRLLDEVFYPGYRKTAVKSPVFIVSNPRSGTTYMHRLLCLDEERFTYFLLYHTFLPSVIFYRFILFLKRIDRKMNWPLKRFFNRVEDRVFEGWKDIHPMGFERSEEDEGLFVLSLMSPAVGLICPYFSKMEWMWIADQLSDQKKQAMMAYYRNTIQRFLYAWGPDKVFLSKNVISTGRIQMLLDAFPEARIVFPVRHPYKTIPSITSMFAAPWGIIAPDIPKNSPEYRTWGKLTSAFYLHFLQMSEQLDPQRFYWVKYNDFVQSPKATVLGIYEKFGWEVSPQFIQMLEAQTSKGRSYKSKHSYSLEKYGYRKEDIYAELKPVFDRFDFQSE